MRLALYSNQEHPENAEMDARVMRLIGVARPRIVYVSAAVDPQRIEFQRKRAYYATLNADLATYVDCESHDIERAFTSGDAIHLSGGNTFEFLRWLKASGVLALLRRYVREDRGVLIGVSAGAILMTPSVATAALCGDIRPSGPIDDAALALVDFSLWPHYVSGMEFDSALQAIPSEFAPLYGCADGTGIVVDGDRIELLGAVSVARHG